MVVNEFGSPVVTSMFLAAYELLNVSFYGYANGDIIFDHGLNETLNKMSEHISSINISMLYGTRRNYAMLPEVNYTNDPLWSPIKIARLVLEKQTKLFRPDSFDYFFVTRKYPFHQIRPVVLGRQGIDTYLAGMSNKLNLTSIVGTGSITALHQTDSDGNFAHHALRNKSDMNYNLDLTLPFNCWFGWSINAKYGSTRSKNGTVFFKCQ